MKLLILATCWSLISIAMLLSSGRVLVRAIRHAKRRCKNCGYDVRANTLKCSECGTSFDSSVVLSLRHALLLGATIFLWVAATMFLWPKWLPTKALLHVVPVTLSEDPLLMRFRDEYGMRIDRGEISCRDEFFVLNRRIAELQHINSLYNIDEQRISWDGLYNSLVFGPCSISVSVTNETGELLGMSSFSSFDSILGQPPLATPRPTTGEVVVLEIVLDLFGKNKIRHQHIIPIRTNAVGK